MTRPDEATPRAHETGRDQERETQERKARARHEEIDSRPGLPRLDVWTLAPNLLAGRNPLSERDVLDLVAAGVTHVLDLREKREWSGPGRFGQEALDALAAHGIQRTNIPVGDFSAPTPAAFSKASHWLDAVTADPAAVVYTHCRAGIQRTPTILAAWLARRDGIGFDAALARLRADGYPGAPLPDQREAALDWLRGPAPRSPRSKARGPKVPAE
jgi:hypothetical protein